MKLYYERKIAISERKQSRPRSTYTPKFKQQQLVNLYLSGKRICNIVKEYDIVSSLLDKWIAQADNYETRKIK